MAISEEEKKEEKKITRERERERERERGKEQKTIYKEPRWVENRKVIYAKIRGIPLD